jgi:predicted CXXCH cytochrome family protein
MKCFLVIGTPALALLLLLWGRWLAWQRNAADAAYQARVGSDLPSLQSSSYVSSARCQACHPAEYASWHRTYHRTMTQAASPEAFLGTFNDATVISDGLAYRVFRDADGFWAEMPDPDVMMYVFQGGRNLAPESIPRVTRPVVMATGSHHYQTYWVASERYSRLLQTLPLVYLIADQRWIPREAAFMRPPHDTGRFITQWNHHCIRCHSTGGNPGLDDKTGLLNSEVGELGISCEACHGPAEAHARRHQDPLTRYQHRLSAEPDRTIVNPEKLNHRLSSHVCGQCHGVYIMREEFAMEYARHGPLFKPGDDLEATRYYIQHPTPDSPPGMWEDLRKNPEFFRERWWDDGTILAGGREFTAMSASACYQRGTLSCLSCHSMHGSDPVDQLKPNLDGNAACTQCHQESKYLSQLSRHTFHSSNSAGSECLNCHMPHTTYALLKGIRSHQIQSPRIAPSARHGVPNACNLCHLDKTLAWTGEHLSRWYGQPPEPLTTEQQSNAASLLWLLKGHAAQRVITAWHVGWQPAQAASGADWLAPFMAHLLDDPYGVVRYVAGLNLRRLPGFEDHALDFLAPSDELARQVRHVQDRWRARTNSLSRTGPEILLTRGGRVLEGRVAELIANRDDRPVTIKE